MGVRQTAASVVIMYFVYMKYLLQHKVFGCKARLSKGKIVSSGVLIRMAS